MHAFVVFSFPYQAKNVSEMTYFVLSGT